MVDFEKSMVDPEKFNGWSMVDPENKTMVDLGKIHSRSGKNSMVDPDKMHGQFRKNPWSIHGWFRKFQC